MHKPDNTCDACGADTATALFPDGELFYNEATGLAFCNACDARNADNATEDAVFARTPGIVANADDVNAAIRGHWRIVCGEFPNATTPHVARKVADDIGVSVSRVFEAFPAPRDNHPNG